MDAAHASQPEGMIPDGSRLWKVGVIFAVALGFVMAMLDVTVVNVALGDIQREFTSPLSTLVWIIDAYTLTFASLLLLGGSLADRIGAKRTYISGLMIFVLASAVCGLATSASILVVARLLQGVGAAFFLPSSLTLLTQSFPDPVTRTRMIGVYGAFVGAAAGSGPFVGGLVVHELGWRSIFYLNLPIGALGVILTAILLRPSKPKPRPFDVASHLLLMGALSGVSFTLIEGHSLGWFASRTIVFSVLVALASITLFAVRERLASHPVIPHALLHNRRFWTFNATGTLMSAVLFGEIFVVTLFLEKARGASAFMAGIQMLPIMGVFAFVNYYAGRISSVWSNRRIMIVGYGTAALGAASTILVGGAAPYWLLALTLGICNLGLGFSGPAMMSSVMHEAGRDHANIGSATLSANRQIGALCSVALMGLLLDVIPDWESSLRAAFTVFAFCMVTAAVLVRQGVTAARPAMLGGEP
ncbi:methylenomycin A resistance protein [Aliidongia dinghuensis]|uniref:Methylenomycin A resistance protein n=1 Tax=Aliidongia dinghuensis TaxID=1867774 RepID=A0A8J2YXB8_9PROT|nr:MFS transporter [Aliidongia dinghuensis]GGF35883.1 methylenomycin A resistance protein [Aliidongia dinghuensis]